MANSIAFEFRLVYQHPKRERQFLPRHSAFGEDYLLSESCGDPSPVYCKCCI